jgi:hypothetical protein
MARKIPIASRVLGHNVGIIKIGDLPALVKAIGAAAPAAYDAPQLLIEVNNALLTYFVACRVRHRSPVYEFESWCNRLAKSAASTLQMLGLHRSGAPYSQADRGAIAGLFPPEQDAIFYRSLRKYGLPEDPDKAMLLFANCLAYMQGRAANAAAFYAERKGAADKLDLSPRQSMIAEIGDVYERLTGERLPQRPNPEHSPFVRFALAIAKLASDRMVPPAEQPTFPKDDGFDYQSALELKNLGPEQVADDVRRAVWPKRNASAGSA